MARTGTETRQRPYARQVRLSEAEYHEIARKAEAAGLPVSEFLRRAALRRQVWSTADRDTVIQLGKIGSALKSIRTILGRRRGESDRKQADMIHQAMDELQGTLRALNGGKLDASSLAPDETEPGRGTEPADRQTELEEILGDIADSAATHGESNTIKTKVRNNTSNDKNLT